MLEIVALPYTIQLDVECTQCCRGSIIRQPDGVEASFNCADSLFVLLECMSGQGWWQANREAIEARLGTLLK